MIQLLNGPWRCALADVASTAEHSLLIAVPYLKYEEVKWLCEQIRPDIEITTLANIDPDAVSASALDIGAIRYLAEASPLAQVIALPNLHAKVFIADEKAAIVTSGNLTRSALDRNIEYGVLLHREDLVQSVLEDMQAFARLGSKIESDTILELEQLETSLRQARAAITITALPEAKRKFSAVMRRAKPILASAQVGKRSSNAVFGEAIKFALAHGPLTTPNIAKEVSKLMPALCDDSEELVINGQQYGKAWKHRLRNAQQHLKRNRIVTYDSQTRQWAISSPTVGEVAL